MSRVQTIDFSWLLFLAPVVSFLSGPSGMRSPAREVEADLPSWIDFVADMITWREGDGGLGAGDFLVTFSCVPFRKGNCWVN